MKFSKVDISNYYFELSGSYYSVYIHLYTKYDDSIFDYSYFIDDYSFYLLVLDVFGSLEISGLQFVEDCIYLNFNLDNDLFVEFKNFLDERGVNRG